MALEKLKQLFLGIESSGGDSKTSAGASGGDQSADPSVEGARGRRKLFLIGGICLIVVVAFVGGYFVADDSGEVSDLEDQIASVEDELDGTEDQASFYADEIAELEESTESLEGKLHAERSLNGKTSVAQNSEFETDFDWETAGTVGYLTMKPIDISHTGERWVLTIEAKNESNEPKSPFCGSAGANLEDSAERVFSGESVISEASDSCEELQPGLTGTFQAEFKLPEDAEPAIAIMYGDYEQEEEAKVWALPEE